MYVWTVPKSMVRGAVTDEVDVMLNKWRPIRDRRLPRVDGEPTIEQIVEASLLNPNRNLSEDEEVWKDKLYGYLREQPKPNRPRTHSAEEAMGPNHQLSFR